MSQPSGRMPQNKEHHRIILSKSRTTGKLRALFKVLFCVKMINTDTWIGGIRLLLPQQQHSGGTEWPGSIAGAIAGFAN